MGGLFGGGSSAPAPKKPEPEVKKPDTGRREQAAAMQARRTGTGQRSLLSPTRQNQAGQAQLSTKLGGGE